MSVLEVRPERANLTIGHLYHERAHWAPQLRCLPTEDPRIYNARWSKQNQVVGFDAIKAGQTSRIC